MPRIRVIKKQPKPDSTEYLPLVTIACICEKVLKEGQVHSYVRVVDTLFVNDSLEDAVGKQKSEGVEFPMINLAIMLRAGKARGSFEIDLISEEPDGEISNAAKIGIKFDESITLDHTSIAIDVPVRLRWKGFGTYWFDVSIRGKSLTKIPLLVTPKSLKKT